MITKKILLREGRADVTLSTYIIDDSAEMLNGKTRPAVLVCPGGGYLYCSDREAEPVALRFAAMGYHAFVLRYSTYYKEEGEPLYDRKLEPRQESAHPAPVQDIGLAMRYICEHAEEWLVDTQKIAICGFSAGSHNCAMYASNWNKPLITEFIKVKEGIRPAAVILGYGVFDNRNCKENEPVIKFPDLMSAYMVALSGEEKPNEEKCIELSPAIVLDDSFPPTFLWATASDETVPAIQTVCMGQRLMEKNIPVEMHIFEQGMHGLSLATQATAMARSNCKADIAVWVDMVEQWLQKRFLLPLPEKTIWE